MNDTPEEQYIKIDRDGNKFYFKDKAMTLYHRLDGSAVEAADGCKEWWVDGNCHRLDGPSVEYADGSKAWYVDGKRHRLDGPAFEGANGNKAWFVDGKQHRLDGPAIEDTDGDKEWWVNGKRHRLDGPATEYTNECKAWFVDGKRHRLDGPATEYASGVKEWWVNGKRLSEEAFDTLTKPLEPMDTMNDAPTYAMLADMLAVALRVIRSGYGGQVADPDCGCEDCEFLVKIDKALQSLTNQTKP